MSFVDGTGGGFLEIELWLALGADTAADPATWSWTHEITNRGLDRAGVRITFGAADEQAEGEPCQIELNLFNSDGELTARNPMSAYYPYLRQAVPIKVRFAPNGTDFYEFVGLTSALMAKWDISQKDVWVPVLAHGLLKRPTDGQSPARSDIFNTVMSWAGSGLVDYWTFEDGTLARNAGSALSNGDPMRVTGRVDFATSEGPPGSNALPSGILANAGELSAGGKMAATDTWYFGFVFKAEVGANEQILRFKVPGNSKFKEFRVLYIGGEGPPFIGLDGIDLNNVQFTLAGIDAGEADEWHSCVVVGEWDGVDLSTYIMVDDLPDDAPTVYAVADAGGGIHDITVSPNALENVSEDPPPAMAFGHLWTASALPDTPRAIAAHFYQAMVGHDGERAVDRLERECSYNPGLWPDYTAIDETDDFSANQTDTWGTTDFGYAWSGWGAGGTVQGSDFQVASGKATHSVPIANAFRYTWLDAYVRRDVRVRVTMPDGIGTANVAGGSIEPGNIMLRVTPSATRYYLCRVSVDTAEAITLAISDSTGPTLASGSLNFADDFLNTNQALKVEAEVVGSTVRMRVWPAADPDKPFWDLEVEDTREGRIRDAGGVGIRSGRASGNSNTSPFVFAYDDFRVWGSDYRMGARRPMTVDQALQDIARSTGGVLYELPNGRIRLDTAQDRLDLDVTLTLDYSAGDISPPFEPTEDDQRTVNDATVSRPDGASGRFALTSGAMSTETVSPGVGPNPGTGSANPHRELDLVAHAGHLVARGTVDRERYPTVRIDGHANPGLIEDAMAAARRSRRVVIENLPTAFGFYDDADLIVEGGEIYLDFYALEIVLNLVPYQPYQAFYLVDASNNPPSGQSAGWLVPTTCVTDEALDTTETGVDILSVPLWETDSGNYPVDIAIGGERMTVTACSGAGPGQTLTVTRSVNGVVKSHSTAAPVIILEPGIMSMEA